MALEAAIAIFTDERFGLLLVGLASCQQDRLQSAPGSMFARQIGARLVFGERPEIFGPNEAPYLRGVRDLP